MRFYNLEELTYPGVSIAAGMGRDVHQFIAGRDNPRNRH
jgi:hypothetical protein